MSPDLPSTNMFYIVISCYDLWKHGLIVGDALTVNKASKTVIRHRFLRKS